MNKFARLLAMLLAMMLCITGTLAAFAESDAEPAAEATAEPLATDVLVTVNGSEITRSKIDAIVSELAYTYAQYGYDTSDAAFQQVLSRLAIDYAVQLELMKLKGIENGLDQFTEEEKTALAEANTVEWSQIVDNYVTYYGGLTGESTEADAAAARVNVVAMLEGMGYTESGLLENTMENIVLDRVQATMIEGAAVADEEIRARFDALVAQDEASYKEDVGMYEYMTQYYGEPSYYVPEGFRGVTHILLMVDETLMGDYQSLCARMEEQEEAAENPEETAAPADADAEAEPTAEPEEPVTQADVDAAYQAIMDSVQPTIDEINQKLAEGVSFDELIAQYGEDPGMEVEPNKSEGYSVHMDSVIYDPVFVQAAFSVNNVGDIAQPVLGSYGVHIVCYKRDVPAGPVAFTADIELALHEELLGEKENELFNATMEQWMTSAVIAYSAEAQAIIDAVDNAQ